MSDILRLYENLFEKSNFFLKKFLVSLKKWKKINSFIVTK